MVHMPVIKEELRTKISGIRRGERIKVVPMSMKEGDSYTTLGIPCTTPAREVYELDVPFFARLDSFDGESLWLSSENHFCLKIPYDDLKDISVLINVPTDISKPLLF